MLTRCKNNWQEWQLIQLEDRCVPSITISEYPAEPILDGAVRANLRRIAATGQSYGYDIHTFSKFGDSITYDTNYLNPLGAPTYAPMMRGLAGQAELLETVARYHGSFARPSLAAYPGWRISNVLAAAEAEIMRSRAGIALIMIGTNDAATFVSDDTYRAGIEQLVDFLTTRGVIPILSTIPHRVDNATFNQTVNRFNQILSDVADDRNIPLMDLARVLDSLPGGGLSPDGLHLNASPNGGGSFFPADRAYGQNARGWLTLKTLARVHEALAGPTAEAIVAESGLLPWSPFIKDERLAVVGPAQGQPAIVMVTNPETGVIRQRFLAFESSFLGGVRVAIGDLTGDGIPDLVLGAGEGGGPVVRGIDGVTGDTLFQFFAYETTFRGGIHVAVADLTLDGKAEIIVGAGHGGGPRVRVYSGDSFEIMGDFLAFESTFRGGVTVAAGRSGHTGFIAVGSGVGGGGLVKLYSGTGEMYASHAVFDENYRGGVSVAAGDLTGDRTDDLILGKLRQATVVAIMTTEGHLMNQWMTNGKRSTGVQVGVVPAKSGQPAYVLAGVVDSAAAVSLYNIEGTRVGGLVGGDLPVFHGGVSVSGG